MYRRGKKWWTRDDLSGRWMNTFDVICQTWKFSLICAIFGNSFIKSWIESIGCGFQYESPSAVLRSTCLVFLNQLRTWIYWKTPFPSKSWNFLKKSRNLTFLCWILKNTLRRRLLIQQLLEENSPNHPERKAPLSRIHCLVQVEIYKKLSCGAGK